MSDSIHITCLAAHQVTCSVLIVKCEILLKKFSVNRITHTVKNILRTCLKKYLREKSAYSPYYNSNNKYNNEISKHTILFILNNPVNDKL